MVLVRVQVPGDPVKAVVDMNDLCLWLEQKGWVKKSLVLSQFFLLKKDEHVVCWDINATSKEMEEVLMKVARIENSTPASILLALDAI